MMLTMVAEPVIPGPLTTMPTVSPAVLGTVMVVVTGAELVEVEASSTARSSAWV